MGSRMVPFSRVLYIEREDFMEEPPPKFYRLAPGREVACGMPISSSVWAW